MNSLTKWLCKCNQCNGSGKVIGMGGIKKECEKCKWRRLFFCRIDAAIRCFFKWLCGNPFKKTPVWISIVFFITMCFVFIRHPDSKTFSISMLVASFGSIFLALKYKLDQANYNKTLFEDRFQVFCVLEKVLHAICHHETKLIEGKTHWQDIVSEMDTVYRKSYFLFSNETYKFIEKFRREIINMSHSLSCQYESNDIENTREFIYKLCDRQELAKKFPELKIDTY